MRRKISSTRRKKDYFTKETGNSIVKFILANDTEKNQIFSQELKKPMTTLVNNLIHVYNLEFIDNVSSLRDDCIRFLFEKISTFDINRPEKAFSYFNIVAKHWLFQQHNNWKRVEKKFSHIDESVAKNFLVNKAQVEYDNQISNIFQDEFFIYLIHNLEKIQNKCTRPKDQIVINSIVELIKNAQNLDIVNRRAAIMYIKNMTHLNQKQIVSSLYRIRKIYYEIKDYWLECKETVD